MIEVLNRYLGEMSDAIMDHGGTLVAYMGDGIMAVFGAPIEQPDHADRALAAAREMLRGAAAALQRVDGRRRASGDGFAMGIGINSGTVMSGQVGSERRIEYTAIGDTTNTAARLEGMTKGSGHQLFVADSTRQALARRRGRARAGRRARGPRPHPPDHGLDPVRGRAERGAQATIEQGGAEEEEDVEGLVDGDPQSR